MGVFTLSNRERRECIQNYYGNENPLSFGQLSNNAKEDITKLSFRKFCHLMRVDPTRDQLRLVRLVFSRRITIVAASHSVGKTHVLSLLLLYVTICKKGLGISSAPTARQVKLLLWRTLAENYNRLRKNPAMKERFGIDLDRDYTLGHTFLREMTVNNIKQDGYKLWYEKLAVPVVDDMGELDEDKLLENMEKGVGSSFGITARTSDSFQGIHSDFMLICLDELSGIEQEIIDAAISCCAGKNNYLVGVGNPLSMQGAHYRMAKTIGCYRLTCFTHPNVAPYYTFIDGRWRLTDDSCLKPDWKPVIEGAVVPSWIENAIETYSYDSLYVETRILAKFPSLDKLSGAMFTNLQTERAMEARTFDNSFLSLLSVSRLFIGADIGESGDPTVVTVCNHISYGDYDVYLIRGIFRIETDGSDLIQQQRNFEAIKEIIASFLVTAVLKPSDVCIAIDAIGIGISVVKDLSIETQAKLLPTYFNASPFDKKSFENVRAEVYWGLKTAYEQGKVHIFNSVLEVEADQLSYELSGIRYELNEKTQKVKLISKQEIKTILGCSPNHGDSVALAVYCAMYFDGVLVDSEGVPVYQN